MRLIDADVLIKSLDDAIQDAKRKNEIGDYWEDDRSNLLYYLDNAPTIDAVEVVRGEWIVHKERAIVRDNNFIEFFPTEYKCSNCGLREAHYFIDSTPHNYCPNCGARMKGADDE